MSDYINAALALGEMGFKVFPITPGVKAPPLLLGWPKHATTDAVTIHRWWTNAPDANIGIHCDGFIVIDVDVKKKGDLSLRKLEMLHDLPPTLTTLTPSGGRHLFYRCDVPVANGVDVLGAGLDIRSRNGYVVAPGSTVPAGRYRFLPDHTEIATAPEWLVRACQPAPEQQRHDVAELPDADQEIVDRAMAWLRTAERSVKGHGGDQSAYRVACQMRDFGLSYDQACTAMRSEAWDYGCGWRMGWLEDKPIRSAYRYAQNDGGAKQVVTADAFDAVPASELPPPAPRARPKVQTLADMAQAASVNSSGYLIKGLLQRGSYAELFGQPGSGKTFVALDLAYHVAAGEAWMDRKVHQGVALYLPFEGRGGLSSRAVALHQHYGSKAVPLYIADGSFNLREKEGRQQLGELIAELPAKPVFIVIDTFAHALMGADENSAQDVGAFNNAVQALIQSTGACVLILHHPTKAGGTARGSGALLGAIDTEIEVDNYTLTVRKQRDMALASEIHFKLESVMIGEDADGDAVQSCVVLPAAAGAKKKSKLKGNAEKAWQVLCEGRPDGAPITMTEWQDACVKQFLSPEGARKRMYEVKTTLRAMGYITIDDDLVLRKLE